MGCFKRKYSIFRFYFDLFYIMEKSRSCWTNHVLRKVVLIKVWLKADGFVIRLLRRLVG